MVCKYCELYSCRICCTRRSDEVLTYGFVNPQDLWFPTEETPDRSLQDRPGAWGLYPSGMLVRTLRLRDLPELEHAKASAQGSGAGLSLRLPPVSVGGA